MDIESAGVVGLGTMGAGIVEVLARAGLPVTAVEVNDDLLSAGRERLTSSLGRAVERGRLAAAERDAIVDRVAFTTMREQLAAVALVVEAVPERLDIKTALLRELDGICPAETVLATNTSSLPVTELAAATARPGRVIGMHFFNPAPVMRLVEVISTVMADTDVLAAVRSLAERCGKTPVVVGDRAGFVANALLFGYLNDAARAAETGQAPIADLDAAIVASTGFPMGPLTLLDLVGLDVSLDVLQTLFDETRDPRYAPAPVLRRLVMAGWLGRKTGRGYYAYDESPPVPSIETPALPASSPRPSTRVAGVGGARKSDVLAAFEPVVVTVDEVADAHVVLVDGGTLTATTELATRVAARLPERAVIAVATSDEAPVAVIAAATGRPADVVGVHLPLVPRRGVVEIVVTARTDAAAAATVAAAAGAAGLTPVVCRDQPGRLLDALLLPHLNDAVRMVGDGYASAADVEAAMTLGCGYPEGPTAMIAAIGPDELRSRLVHLAAATHRQGLAPAPLLDDLAAFGG